MEKVSERHLKALRTAEKLEHGESAAINRQDAEECENKGWLEAQPKGGYRLTTEGRKALREATG